MSLKIQKAALEGHLNQLVRCRDPYLATEGYFYVQKYIQQIFSRVGEVTAHRFEISGRQHTNWVLDLPGQFPDRPPILIGAHYDAVPGSPGADDNATGVAVLLELAQYFAQTMPRSPLRLVAFDLEEYGLAGSRAYAAELRRHRQPLRLMLSLEMLGYCQRLPQSQQYPHPLLKRLYPSTGDFIALIGNGAALPDLIRMRRWMRQAQARCEWLPVIQQGRPLPDTRRSDHAPFWDEGYRAILVTDTANLRNPHYHQPSDTISTLDLAFLTQVAGALASAIARL